MNIRISPSCWFARLRALRDGRTTVPFARMAIIALMLIGFAHSTGSQTPRAETKPKPLITKPPKRSETSKPQDNKPATKKQPGNSPVSNLAQEPTLYVVGYAHLDTEWRWEYPQVIQEYLPKTMRNNFALFEKYPHYIFNFTGANRYRLMKEYYPADFERLKHYVAIGRW